MADNARYDCGGGVAKGGHLVRARDSVRVRDSVRARDSVGVRVGDMVRLLTMAILKLRQRRCAQSLKLTDYG